MTLNEELANWVATRPDWQKDAVTRFCRNETLSANDVIAIVNQLIEGTYPPAPDISTADVPGSTAAGDPVTLSQVANVAGVNALLSGQTLSFSASGLTVIFGNNSSGKSGYARLIREAVTARVKSGQLLGDVFAENETPQTATIGYSVGADPTSWQLGDSQSLDLSRIRFYHEDCGDAYVTKASEVDYQPSALTILDQLSNTCEMLTAEMGNRLSANDAGRPQFPAPHPDTAASRFLSSLSPDTTPEAIEAATTLYGEHDVRLSKYLAEEARLKGSDPNKEKSRLTKLSRDWSTIAAHTKDLGSSLNQEALEALKCQLGKADQLREAARIASAQSFDSEPVASVGSETWRALWDAAREFSLTDAYHDHEYPFTREDAVCVLCQQPLSAQAADRLTRLEAFVADTTSRDADAAAASLAAIKNRLDQFRTLPSTVSSAASRLQDGGEEVQDTLAWLESAVQTATVAIKWIDDENDAEPEPVLDTISGAAAERSQALNQLAEDIDATTFAQTLATTSKEVIELQDAKALSEARSAIGSEVARLRQRKKIEDARRLTATNSITTKRGELTESYVTQEVRDHFTRETERLELRRVTLNRTGRGREKALKHRPSLVGSRHDAEVEVVLSEGEQTALGLAGFLTEVELDASFSGIIFDDPVSSLDAGRRTRVAQRLIELAAKRQVIIFTHEITFVQALLKEAKRRSVAVESRSVQRMGGSQPGLVSDQLPWTAQDIPQRINGLESELASLKKVRAGLTDEQYAEQIGSLTGRLSEALERAVNLHIVNELVDRGTNEVHPTMLKILPKFTQDDHDEYQAAYAKTSSWAARHDNAPEENYVPPTIDEVKQEVAWLRGWHSRVKKYAN